MDKVKLIDAVSRGSHARNTVDPELIIGDASNGYDQGDILDANSVQEKVEDIQETIGGLDDVYAPKVENGYIENPDIDGVSGQILSLDSLGNTVWSNPTEGSVTDSTMSDISENPVQNKTIKAYVDSTIYDISVNHPTSGVDDGNTYTSLSEALAVIPQDKQKGGMTVRYIQSSDNKYVKFFCTADEFTTDVTQWQGVDTKVTQGSRNLVDSEAVSNFVLNKLGEDIMSEHDIIFENVSGASQYRTTITKNASGKYHLHFTVNSGTTVTSPTATNAAINIYINNVSVKNVAQNVFAGYELPWTFDYNFEYNGDFEVLVSYRLNGTGSVISEEEGLGSPFVEKEDIVNDLTTGGTNKPLSAEQGKNLNQKISQEDDDLYNGGTYTVGDASEEIVGTASYNTGGGTTFCVVGYGLGGAEEGMPKSGVITKITINCATAGQVDFYKVTRPSTNRLNIEGLICSKKASIGLNEINCFCPIKKGEFVGLALIGANAATVNCVAGQAFLTTGVGRQSFSFQRVYTAAMSIEINTTSLYGCNDKDYNIKQNAFLYDSYQRTSEWVSTSGNWGGSNGFESSTSESYQYLNLQTGMDRQCIRFVIQLVDTNLRLGICGAPYAITESVNAQAHFVMFNFQTKKIQICKQWSGNVMASNPSTLVEKSMMETLYQNRNYILEVEYNTTKTVKARIIDSITQECVEAVHTNVDETHVSVFTNLPVGMLLRGGTAKILRVSQYSLMPVRPTLMIIGDSFVQGWNLIRYEYDSDDCYSHLIEEWLGQNHFAMSCRGGEAMLGFLNKLDTDMQLFKPKYVLIEYGLNEDLVGGATLEDFKERMSIIINACRKAGAEPILCNYSGNTNPRAQYTSWINDSYLGFRVFDQRSALASGNDFAPDSNLFLPDGHPNVAGNERLFKCFKTFFADLLADRN